METEIPRRFRDFAQEHRPLDGSKMKVEEIIGREILLLAYRLKPSKYGAAPCLTIQFELAGQRHVTFTGSQVLAEQMRLYGERLPFYATLAKIDRYYTLT
jgi:hypothetical protein